MKLKKFSQIKKEWESTQYLQDASIDLEKYITMHYTPVYSKSLNFIGYTEKEQHLKEQYNECLYR
jgi:hypothetical protein